MTPTAIVSRLRRLANDWRKEEKQLCEQFSDEIIPRSMRARRIKDAQAIDAAIEMIERLEAAEKERDDVAQQLVQSEQGKRKISEECDALRARIEAMEKQEPVAVVESWANGSYSRNYKLRWLKDAAEGANLYLAPGAKGE